MFVRVLNKFGFYTARQMREIELYVEAVEHRIDKYIEKCKRFEEENKELKDKVKRLVGAVGANEEAKSLVVEENERLRKEINRLSLRNAKSVKVCKQNRRKVRK